MKRTGYKLGAGLIWLAMWLSGCAGLASPTAKPQAQLVVIASPTDTKVSVQVEERQAVLDISSPSGIGSVQTQIVPGATPTQITLRLRLKGLEKLEFTYGGYLTTVSISSKAEQTVYQYRCQAQPDGGCQGVMKGTALTSDDPHWLAVRVMAADGSPGTIPLEEGGWIEVQLPNTFFQSGARGFSLNCVDFYR